MLRVTVMLKAQCGIDYDYTLTKSNCILMEVTVYFQVLEYPTDYGLGYPGLHFGLGANMNIHQQCSNIFQFEC